MLDNSEFVYEAKGFNVIKELDSNYRLVMARFKDTMKSCFINMAYRLKNYMFILFGLIFFITICPNLTFDQNCPTLIPAKSLYTNLVIAHNNVNSGHMSIHYTRSKLRNRFWIPSDTPVIKSVLNKCQDYFDKRVHVPDSLDLPEFRFDSKNPWKITFLDMTNHYLIKDASAKAFANLCDRVCSKNGELEKISSDQGNNFRAFINKLKTISGCMVWDYESDVMHIKEPALVTTYITNCSLLSNIARIFDPGGKINDLVKSEDGEIRKSILNTDHSEGVYPISNFRFLDQQISPKISM